MYHTIFIIKFVFNRIRLFLVFFGDDIYHFYTKFALHLDILLLAIAEQHFHHFKNAKN
jgi:hypothetical protein